MRVLMISLDRGLFGDGYSGDVLARHKRYADAIGNLDVIVFADKSYADWQPQPNLRIFSTKSRKMRHFKSAAALAKRLHSESPYELLVTQEFASPAGAAVKRFAQIPWLVNIHGMFFSSAWLKRKPLNWYLYFLIKNSIKKANGFRVNNQVIRKKLEDWGIRKPILVQPTPIDLTAFQEEGQQPKPGGDLATILYVGRLSKEKNIPMLIRAAKDLEADFALKIVGSGAEESKLKRLAGTDQRIQFLGPKKIEQLPEIFKSAHIFVLPSNTESFGQVLLQAAASGCAIVATKTSGAVQVLTEPQSAILIAVNDERELKRSLKMLIENKDLRSRLAEKARSILKRFDPNRGTEQTIKFWQSIAGKTS